MARRRASSSRTDNILGLLQSRGIQRGVMGTSRSWMWIAVVLLLITFLLGRRGGKKKTTIVEIRRV